VTHKSFVYIKIRKTLYTGCSYHSSVLLSVIFVSSTRLNSYIVLHHFIAVLPKCISEFSYAVRGMEVCFG